jgi:hypothetical protein
MIDPSNGAVLSRAEEVWPLVCSGIARKPGRTVLIILQACVAFALFDPLPLASLECIQSGPGVRVVAPVELFRATYQTPDKKLGVVAVRPDGGGLSAFTFTIAPDTVAAFRKNRTATIIRDGLARKCGLFRRGAGRRQGHRERFQGHGDSSLLGNLRRG